MDGAEVDENIWEKSKENVQPLRSGRKVASIKAALQPSVEHSRSLMKERQQFEEEILSGEDGPDPIGPWDKYLKWTQQNFPIGENKLTFENILRKFISKFLKCDSYKNDPRYINAWILLAQISDNPENIFSYMKSESIGAQCASFYVAWADELEKYGKHKKAAGIFQLGEDCGAEPFCLLRKMKNAFEMRCARDAMKRIEIDRQSSSSGSVVDERMALKKVGSRKRLPFSVSKSQSGSTKSGNSNTPGVRIFEDDDCSLDYVGKWAELPDSAKANKENAVLKPGKWKEPLVGQRSRPKRARPVPDTSALSGFVIFDDCASTPVSAAPSSSRKVAKTVERVLTDSKTPSAAEPLLRQVLSDCCDGNDAKVVRCYPMDKVYSVLGELQLEEVFAAERRKNSKV